MPRNWSVYKKKDNFSKGTRKIVFLRVFLGPKLLIKQQNAFLTIFFRTKSLPIFIFWFKKFGMENLYRAKLQPTYPPVHGLCCTLFFHHCLIINLFLFLSHYQGVASKAHPFSSLLSDGHVNGVLNHHF